MSQQLIPIIAAYWGAECSYELHHPIIRGFKFIEGELYEAALNDIRGQSKIRKFKLHLRPLWSITEEELRELGEVLGLKDVDISIKSRTKRLRDSDKCRFYLCIIDENYFEIDGDSHDLMLAINHLRAKGFCVDQELVDANLVEWKEV